MWPLSLSSIRAFFTGKPTNPTPSSGDESLLGYSPEFITEQIAEVRTSLVKLRSIADDIANHDPDSDGAIDLRVTEVCNAVGKVCDNLKRDREDYSKVDSP